MSARTETVEFNYDGDDWIVATITGAQIGVTYYLAPDYGNEASGTAVSSMLVLATTFDNGDLSPGEGNGVAVYDDEAFLIGSNYVACACFVKGDPAQLDIGAVWSFDGNDTVTCTWFGEIGETYVLASSDVMSGGNSTYPPVIDGAGATIIQTIGSFSPPYQGDYFQAYLMLGEPGNLKTIAARLFEAGVAGSGTDGQDDTPTSSDPDRFYEAPAWRFVVTNLDSETMTFLDHLATDRSVTFMRAAACVIGGSVPSDNPEVNMGGDDPVSDALLSEGNKLLYCFRREGGSPPWKIRAAGLVMEIEDAADGSSTQSVFTAYDPWKYLYRRPVLAPGTSGDLPEADGLIYDLETADQIILDQLALSESFSGPMMVDYGQTAFYSGTIQTTDVIDEINLARGSSLGEMLDQLIETGTVDVWFEAIYDPVNRPGMVAQLSIFDSMGSYRPAAVFGWDLFPKNVVALTKLTDGTQRMNRVTYYAGQGGVPAVEQVDAASIAKFGEYFEQRFWPGQTATPAVKEMARRALQLLKNGQLTYTLFPTAERAPVALSEYGLGDTVPVYGTKRIRKSINELLRIEGIPILIGNDELERVNGLLVSVEDATT